ncbi:MAG: winged helix-turn-helix domain-containing protein [Candidatus Micrarchaeota archaeon]
MRLTEKEISFLETLFERIITSRTQIPLFRKEFTSKYLRYAINRKFRRAGYDEDAVLTTDPLGKQKIGRGPEFLVICLNPKIFLNPPKLRPGIDFTIDDVFSNSENKVVKFLLENPYSTKERIAKETGLGLEWIVPLLLEYKINEKARRFGLPKVVKSTGWSPSPYYVTDAFVQVMGLSKKKWEPSFDIFLDSEKKALRYLEKNPNSSGPAIAKALGQWRDNFYRMMKRINRICTEFGLPEAIIVGDVRKGKRYALSSKFTRLFRLDYPQETLEKYFEPIQVKIINIIAANPNMITTKIANRVGVAQSTITRQIKRIDEKCGSLRLPPIRCWWMTGARYALPIEFANRFNLKISKEDPKSLLPDGARKVYVYFQKHPNSDMRTAASKLRSAYPTITGHVIRIKRILGQSGYDFTVKRRRIPGYRKYEDFKEVACIFDEFKKENGKWPTRTDLEKSRMSMLLSRIDRFHGGIRKVREKMDERDKILFLMGEDGRLIKALEGGDNSALKKLWIKYEPRATAIARTFSFVRGLPLDTCESAAKELLGGVIQKFDYWSSQNLEAFIGKELSKALSEKLRKICFGA